MHASGNTQVRPQKIKTVVALATFYVTEVEYDPDLDSPYMLAAERLGAMGRQTTHGTFLTPLPGDCIESTSFDGLTLEEALDEVLP